MTIKRTGAAPERQAENVRALLRAHDIGWTVQRERIAGALLGMGRHVGAEELHAAVGPEIGLATVYRTLRLFTLRGLVEERDFGDGCRRYERSSGTHHDHLVCLGCGAVIEFQEPGIEALQERAAEAHGFRTVSHRLELYGYCRACSGGKEG